MNVCFVLAVAVWLLLLLLLLPSRVRGQSAARLSGEQELFVVDAVATEEKGEEETKSLCRFKASHAAAFVGA